MPVYNFKCPSCGHGLKRLMSAAALAGGKPFEHCGRAMERDESGPSTRITETLDNGVMTKRVERPAEVERLQHQRSHPERYGPIK